MVDFLVTSDNGSGSSIDPVAKAIEAEGFSVETSPASPNAEALRNSGKIKAPGKLVFICNGGQAGQTYASFAADYTDGMAFTIFAFDNYATHFSTTTEEATRNKPLVSEWDSGSFATDSAAKDIQGHTSCSYQAKYPHIFAFIADETSAESLGKRIAKGDYTCGKGSSSKKSKEDDEEEWDDSDNFTPHKGKIMEIRPYKEISSISFDKSYDAPSGTGNVGILYSARDYRTLYKGVAMKLKLRRSCDKQWSATGLEDPDYDEHEKFFKEHIPTDELLKELGLPNYRKQGVSGSESSDSSTENSENSSSNSNSNSNSNSSSNNS